MLDALQAKVLVECSKVAALGVRFPRLEAVGPLDGELYFVSFPAVVDDLVDHPFLFFVIAYVVKGAAVSMREYIIVVQFVCPQHFDMKCWVNAQAWR